MKKALPLCVMLMPTFSAVAEDAALMRYIGSASTVLLSTMPAKGELCHLVIGHYRVDDESEAYLDCSADTNRGGALKFELKNAKDGIFDMRIENRGNNQCYLQWDADIGYDGQFEILKGGIDNGTEHNAKFDCAGNSDPIKLKIENIALNHIDVRITSNGKAAEWSSYKSGDFRQFKYDDKSSGDLFRLTIPGKNFKQFQKQSTNIKQVDCSKNDIANHFAVWGKGFYYSGSDVCAAAVHAGVIDKSGGIATYQVLSNHEYVSIPANTRNGITTLDSDWNWDYKIEFLTYQESVETLSREIDELTKITYPQKLSLVGADFFLYTPSGLDKELHILLKTSSIINNLKNSKVLNGESYYAFLQHYNKVDINGKEYPIERAELTGNVENGIKSITKFVIKRNIQDMKSEPSTDYTVLY